jgi:hypothetical protein
VMLVVVGVLGWVPLQAQEGGFPPWPVIYQGEVYVDGVLLEADAQLTVRVGDWESSPVVVRRGTFLNLVAGPPSHAYDNERITFHLSGMNVQPALQQFQFQVREEPLARTLRLEFGENVPLPPAVASKDEVYTSWDLVLGVLVGFVVLVSGVLAVVWCRLRGGRARAG